MTTVDAPVRKEDRLNYMDVLRGFAVMAIFIVNIKAMAAPFAFYSNATLWTGDNDQLIATIQSFLVDNKWRTNFTALFGAGLVLITAKSMEAGADASTRLRKRLFWLLIFGLFHLLFIWLGDILTIYALTGFLAMMFRNKSAASLAVWAFACLILGGIWSSGMTMSMPFIPDMGPTFWGTNPEILKLEMDANLGGIIEQTLWRLQSSFGMILFFFVLGGFWLLTLGIMLAGMALFKAGFLKGEWSALSYLILAVIALGTSWGLEYYRHEVIEEAGWTFESYSFQAPAMTLAGLLGGFGYASLVGLLLKSGLRFSPVAAVGRMAFTNYIACSLIGTTIAYGHAGAQFGSLTLQQLMLIVGGTFVAMLIWSPLWLAVFRFGPIEWLWRSLTYGKLQPFLK